MKLLSFFLGIVVVFNIIFSSNGVYGALGGKWKVGQLLPSPRSKHGQARLTDTTMFIYGGRNPTGEMLANAYVYSTVTNAFVQVNFQGTNVIRRCYATVVAVQNSRSPVRNGIIYPMIYIWAGLESDTPISNVLQDMQEINPVSWVSTRLDSSVNGRMKHSTIVFGFRLYVVFGVSRGLVNTVQVFNTETKTWSTLDPQNTAPTPRYGACCDAISDTAFMCVGGTTRDAVDTNEVVTFDIQTKLWTIYGKNVNAPLGRRNMGCFYNPSTQAFTISHGWSGNTLKQFGDMWDFDVVNGRWSLVPVTVNGNAELLESVTWTRLAPGGPLYLFGGWGENTTVNAMWMHNVTTTSRVSTMLFDKDIEPLPRTLHCAANIGETMYVMLGVSEETIVNDIWQYDTTTSLWSPSSIVFPTPLFGATCTAFSTRIYVFGGKGSLDNTVIDFSDTLYLFDEIQVQVVPLTTALKPSPRLLHAATMYQQNVVIMGGLNSAGSVLDDIWVFNLQTSQWIPVSMDGPRPSRFKHNLAVILDKLFVGNGFDLNFNYGDRWVVTFAGASAVAEQQNGFLSGGLSQSDVMRSNAATVTGYNSSQVFFIGGNMDEDSAIEANSLHVYNSLRDVNFPLSALPVAVTEASVVFIGRTIYAFGGRQIVSGIVTNEVSLLQTYTFNTSSICPTFDDSKAGGGTCVTCPPGFVPPLCEPCPLNTFFEESTGSCTPCGFGRSLHRTGVVGGGGCLLDNFPSSKEDKFDRPTSLQPSPFTPEETPPMVWNGVIIVAMFGVAFLLALMFGVSFLKERNRRDMLKGRMHDVLKTKFENISVNGTDVGERELFLLFQVLATPESRATITEPWIENLIRTFDENGSREIELDEFEDMIVSCCLNTVEPYAVDWPAFGIPWEEVPLEMRPLSDNDNVDVRNKKLSARGPTNFSLKSLDNFTNEHTVESVGEAMHIKATVSGGLTTVAYYVGVIVIFIALLVVVIYQNTSEERTTLPYVTLPYNISAQRLHARVTFQGTGYAPNMTEDEQQSACSKFEVGVDEIVLLKNQMSNNMDYQPTITCKFEDGTLFYDWICELCTFSSDIARFVVHSSDDRAFATLVNISISSTTGIGETESASSHYIASPVGKVFRGVAVPTIGYVQVFPTVFGRKTDVDNNAVNKLDFGYHLYLTRILGGGVTSQDSFLNANGLSAEIQFQVLGANTLIITRRDIKDALTFLSGLGGAISGFVGVLVAGMRFFDKQLIAHFARKKARELAKDKGKIKTKEMIKQEKKEFLPANAPLWYSYAFDLMMSGLDFMVAKSIAVAIIRKKEMEVQPIKKCGRESNDLEVK